MMRVAGHLAPLRNAWMERMRIAHLIAASLALAVAITPLASAHAQDGGPSEEEIAERVEELSAQGVEHYSAKRYREAIATFEEAYKLAPVANLLYNIGLSWEKLDDPKQAVKAYERFIVASDADPGVRVKALDRIKSLNEEIDRRAAEARQAEEARDAQLNNPDPTPDPTPVQPQEDGLGGLGVAGIVTAGGGLLLLGGGVTFGVLAQSDVDDFTAARTLDAKEAARADAESNALLADIFYGVGGAALVGGIVMLAIDLAGEDQPPASGDSALRLTPWLSTEGAGALLERRF